MLFESCLVASFHVILSVCVCNRLDRADWEPSKILGLHFLNIEAGLVFAGHLVPNSYDIAYVRGWEIGNWVPQGMCQMDLHSFGRALLRFSTN